MPLSGRPPPLVDGPPPSPRLLFKDHIRYTDIYTPILYADDVRLHQMIRESVREELARTTS
jgi:hypothetical protein